jgi:hypothetical protein
MPSPVQRGRERGRARRSARRAGQSLHDVTLDRDDRREGRGFSTAADARAFLALARQGAVASAPEPDRRRVDPAGRCRTVEDAPEAMEALRSCRGGSARAVNGTGAAASGSVRRRSPVCWRVRASSRSIRAPCSGRADHPIRAVSTRSWNTCRSTTRCLLVRGQELAFVANALVAGCRLQSRSFTPRASLGSGRGHLQPPPPGLLRQPAPPASTTWSRHDLIGIFETDGPRSIARSSLFVGEGLLAALRGVQTGESETLAGLQELQQSLETHLTAGRRGSRVTLSRSWPCWTRPRGPACSAC